MGIRSQYRNLEKVWDAAEKLEDLRRKGADTAKLAQAQKDLDKAQREAPKWSRWPH